MRLMFVHGWGTDSFDSYGGLPEAIRDAASPGLAIDIRHIHLGRYISFHDEVKLDDIARAFDHALRHDIPGNQDGGLPFSCITHSTGGPVVRTWLELFHRGGRADTTPLEHLVMLAPANHGSALAQLGKGRLSRIAGHVLGKDPGVGVLDWLELGSDGQRSLNTAFLTNRSAAGKTYFPFVLAGDSPAKSFMDYLNSYTYEAGSDGVIRLTAANLNFRKVKLIQTDSPVPGDPRMRLLEPERGSVVRSPRVPFAVVPNASHTGTDKGIQMSVAAGTHAPPPVVELILACLEVKDSSEYAALDRRWLARAQAAPRAKNGSMLVFDVHDDRGAPVRDYDMLLLAESAYSPNDLPAGFFIDRQRNRLSPQRLTYYLNHDAMKGIKSGVIGIRVTARPDEGFAYYLPGEFRSDGIPLDRLLEANETLYVDVILKRHVDQETFRIEDAATNKRGSFRSTRPGGKPI